MPITITVTNGNKTISRSISEGGLAALLDAIDVGTDGFGQTDTDEAEANETEAWKIILALKGIKADSDDGEDLVDEMGSGLPQDDSDEPHLSNLVPLDPDQD